MDQNKFWYKLLCYKCFTEKKTGLTLPFLIGSQYLCNIENPINIEQLLIEIRNSDNKIIIKYCHQIKEYILTIDKGLISGYIKNKLEFNNLTIIPDNSFLVGIENFDHIIEAFETLYSKMIKQELFSKIVVDHNDVWIKFEKQDKILIKKALLIT